MNEPDPRDRRGFRVSSARKISLSLNFDPEEVDWIVREANRRRVSASYIARELVREKMESPST